MRRVGSLLLLTMLWAHIAALWAHIAAAAEIPHAPSPRATASLVTDSDTAAPGQVLHVALRLRLAPGWHTYWRNPGDAGVAPDLAFTWPAGVTAGPIAWPAPERLTEGELTTFGHTGDVLLPVAVTPPPGGLDIALHAEWLVCERVCVPEQGDFRLHLPQGPGAPSAEAPLFAAAATRAPRPSPWPAHIDEAGVLRLRGPDLGPASVRDAWFAPDAPDRVDLGAPQRLTLADGSLSLALKLSGSGPLGGVLVLRDAGGQASAFEVGAAPGPATGPEPEAVEAPVGFFRALELALLGGLALNVMPCVFPVLAMKAAGLASLAAGERARARRLALSYLAGVIATFCGVGGLLMVLRQAGAAAGWGFQFQHPAFVAAMLGVLFLVGLNLSGVFAVPTGRLAGLGQEAAARPGHAGSFATGALAVLVASPCTAPFMGAAIAAALAAPAPVAMTVFAALGAGLALPYVALAWMPGLRLPRPGRWMDTARQCLALPVYATVAWLGWVLLRQTGTGAAPLLCGILVALGASAWLLGLAQRNGGRRVAGLAALLGGAAAVAAACVVPAPAAERADSFTPGRLAALRKQNRAVFVDMSAAWCVTCLVNERVALAPAAVQRALEQAGVTVLRGDWTRQDAAITAFLRLHGRDGVPLYVLYPPGGGPPALLPQILTSGIVLDALARLPTPLPAPPAGTPQPRA